MLIVYFTDGEFEVLKENNVLGRMAAGRVFGELAILYNCTRTASVRGKFSHSDQPLSHQCFNLINHLKRNESK